MATNPPELVTTPGGTTHNVAASFYTPPANTRDNDPHPVDLTSPEDRAAQGARRLFHSPGVDTGNAKVGSSAQHSSMP